jgi:molecular chaperone GrpE
VKHRHPAPPEAEAAESAATASPGAGEDAGLAANPVADLADTVSTLEAELAKALDARLRAEAEIVNARRRALREIDDAERRGAERTLAPVLAAADDLDRALEAAAQAGEGEGALAKGVALVLSRLTEKLAAEGVTPIVPLGEAFDPTLHEALSHSPHPTIPAGHVSQVIGRGWRHGERLLRAARVLVSSGPPAPPANAEAS